MPRLARKDLNTSFFHVIVQGINREYIFDKNMYKERYVELINHYRTKYKIKLISYCVMDNHAHLLIYTELIKEMSEFMRSINTTYAQYYNRIKNRVGFVFRNRYLSQPIYNDKYLYSCIAYIHNNPVRANIVKEVKQYKYSSYNDYLTKKGIIDTDILKLIFGTEKEYIEIFLNIVEEDLIFIDYEEEKASPEIALKTYCNDRNIKIQDIDKNDKILPDLIRYMMINSNTSVREISSIIKINRNKLNKLMKE